LRGWRWDSGWPQVAGGAIVGFAIWSSGVKMPPEILDNPFLSALVAIALGGFVGAITGFLLRLCWWPIHRQLAPLGGLAGALRLRLGVDMLPVILMASAIVAFIVLFGAGMILFAIHAGQQSQAASSPNTVGNPDFSLYVPAQRYRLTWPGTIYIQFYLRVDTERNPQLGNNPAFILRNKTNTIAYRVSATWKSETAINIQNVVKTSPKLSKADFNISDVAINIISTNRMSRPLANFSYYISDAPKQVVSVIAKEEEIILPPDLWSIAAIYLIDKIPDEIGKTSPPFIARVTLEWETSEGKRQKPYRVGITATNAKSSDTDDPIVDAFLNFTLEEIPQ
jgi:hypothetical protein